MELSIPSIHAHLAAPWILIVWSIAAIAYTALRAARR
jgi:hypothetical protein